MFNSVFARVALSGIVLLCAGCAADGTPGSTGGTSVSPSAPAPPVAVIGTPISATVAAVGSPASSASPCAAVACFPAGAYTTTGFLDGHLTVTVAEPWESGEDQVAEFSGAPAESSGQSRLLFWMDILPVDPAGHRVNGVPATAQAMAAWLAHRPNLSVTTAKRTTVGAARLPATVVDIGLAADAKNEDPGCPASACIGFLTWPNGGENVYGIARPAVVRLYLADVVYNRAKHLFAVAIEATSPAGLKDFVPIALPVINSATGPLTPGQP